MSSTEDSKDVPSPSYCQDRSHKKQRPEQDMDAKLRNHLASLSVGGCDLPMDMGNFYDRYVLHYTNDEDGTNDDNDDGDVELNVHKSSYKCVSKWLHAMEGEGLILLKKHWQTGRAHRKKTATKSVVAVGREQVALFNSHRLAALEQSSSAMTQDENSSSESTCSDDDEQEDDSTDHISIKPTRHAKQMQKKRGITDYDLKQAIEHSKAPLRRKRDGVKVISADGISAVISGGQKHQIITTWKETDSSGGDHMYRWTKLGLSFADDSIEGCVQQRTVTVVEKYQRYDKAGCRIGKYGRKVKRSWEAGARVRKNKKYRKHILVIGLHEDLIQHVVKQIQNQAGIHVAIGTLHQEQWEDIVGDHISPNAAEGSKTISFNLPDESRDISRVLKHIEAVVPPKLRRYLKEENVTLVEGEVPQWRVTDMTSAAREKHEEEKEILVDSIRAELADIYEEYAPDKVKDIPAMLEKYSGKEQALLQAVQRKYDKKSKIIEADNHNIDQDETHLPAKTKYTRFNVEDLLGEDEEDGDEEYDVGEISAVSTSRTPKWEEEDLTTYF